MFRYGISAQVFQRGSTTSTGMLAELSGDLTRYSHSISAVGGFERCALEQMTTLENGRQWLGRLGCPIVATGPTGRSIWEGYIDSVDLKVGDESISLSIDDLANAVRVRYQPSIGGQVSTAFITDAASIATYGRKELIYSGSGMTDTAAIVLRDTLLANRRQPQTQRRSTVATGKPPGGDIQLTILATGWYSALDWLTTSSATTAVAVTTAQVQTLTTAYNATNPWFSTDYSQIVASGVSDTQYIEADTTYRAKVERLLSLGDSTGQRLAWGIYEGRRWTVRTWAGAAPSTIGYVRSLGGGRLTTPTGIGVDPWDVRPDAMYQVAELVPTSPVSGAVDTGETYYVERVTCAIDERGTTLTLEPARSTGLDVLLARIK